MSEVRLVVRESERDWSGTIHGSSADRAIAALSADPITLTELEAACVRYEEPSRDYRFFSNLRSGLCDDPYDAGLVVIDLIARMVVVDSTYSAPGPSGEIYYHDGNCCTDKRLRYHLADDWLFVNERTEWQGQATKRRQLRAENPPLDARAVFYGRPLLEFIARQTFAIYTPQQTTADQAQDAIREIHAAWLLTPRDDLNGKCPREVTFIGEEHLSRDLQNQAEQWTRLRKCPPALDKSSFAYRYGGFGTHELITYYELVREMLWSCWENLDASMKNPKSGDRSAKLTEIDFVRSEVPRLERFRDKWLITPDPEFEGKTPQSIIDNERTRLPEAVTEGTMHDPDCPCCRMMADMPGPAFWHLDGCNMDQDFAFDIYHPTYEEWEADHREWEESNEDCEEDDEDDEEVDESVRWGLTNSGLGTDGTNSVGKSSFSVGDAAEVPLGVRLFGIGGHLAELIADLRREAEDVVAAPEVQRHIDRLNSDFDNLRGLFQISESNPSASLIDPVINCFTESLVNTAAAWPDLSEKCDALANRLAEFWDPSTSEPDWDAEDIQPDLESPEPY